MTDIDKVIEGLEKLRKELGYGLPNRWRTAVVMEYLNSLTDAIELLKEQQKLIDEITCRRANNGAFD